MARIRLAILGIAISLCGAPSWAQDFVNAYEVPYGVSLNAIANQLTHEKLNETLHHWDAYEAEQKRKGAVATRPPLAQTTGLGIAQLAGRLPKDQADAGRAAYSQAFGYHEQVIRKFGLPSGDLGVALASAIAGGWMAYNNKPFPDQYYVPLVNQMRQRLSSSGAGLQSLSAAERTASYESLAVVGMMLASSQITWQRNPRAPGADDLRARMRAQGGQTLTRMLQTPPDRVGIGPSGVYLLAEAGR
ncbi:hypothetical protein ASD89_12715 [Caulobacter sp. Root656]|nr:hypothetical protein ASD89_12715 [Caulobacter sp. Root656]